MIEGVICFGVTWKMIDAGPIILTQVIKEVSVICFETYRVRMTFFPRKQL